MSSESCGYFIVALKGCREYTHKSKILRACKFARHARYNFPFSEKGIKLEQL